MNTNYVSLLMKTLNKRIINGLREDTQETIELLNGTLKGANFKSSEDVRNWFKEKLHFEGNNDSVYRAYLCQNNDDICSIRISNHYSNESTVDNAHQEQGTPNIEYHLIIEKVKLNYGNVIPINQDKNVQGTPIKVKECSLSDFNDSNKKGAIIDQIINILKDGASPSSKKETNTDESNCYVSLSDYITEHLSSHIV